jgi:glycosyltransferase involved in cell wall biosynthesis
LKILIISDAWVPQINGVVRTLQATLRELEYLGHEIQIIGPRAGMLTFRAPYYPEIYLEFFAHERLAQAVHVFAPDVIHIATEGPLGWAARNVCLREARPFTTSYHTRFPEYLATRAPRLLATIVCKIAYAVLRKFHTPSNAVLVATDSLERELRMRKFHRLARWSRGVDTDLFRPWGKTLAAYENLPHPILLYVGRIAVEKNMRAFLDLRVAGSKVVIGDGPDLGALHAAYPQVIFTGALQEKKLAQHYAAADLFVFPSTTDTFGLVLLEAASTGLRIAAYPAPGPLDIFAQGSGTTFAVLNDDLQAAVTQALALPDTIEGPHTFAATFSWEACTRQFIAHISTPNPSSRRRI